jgi:hypothetical protein
VPGSGFTLFWAVLVVMVACWLYVVTRAAIGGLNRAPRRPHARFLAGLAERLELENTAGSHLAGRLDPDDREASVDFVESGTGPVAVFAVEVRSAPRMRLTLESARTRLAKALGRVREIEVGDRFFDDTFLIQVEDEKEARHELARGRVLRDKILGLFLSYQVETLEVKKKHLEARIPVGALKKKRDYAELLRLLAATARAFDRVGIKVKVLGGERLALAGAHGNARCAYCHGDLTGDEPDLVACEACGTVLHEGCWGELGHCPLLGCSGSSPERARVQG